MTATNQISRMSLRNILFANAVFSLVSAFVLIAASGPLADYLEVSGWVLIVVGAALIPWAAFVFANARREPPLQRDTWITIAGDLLWVIAAAVVILGPARGLLRSDSPVRQVFSRARLRQSG